jgi:hypothetical protein
MHKLNGFLIGAMLACSAIVAPAALTGCTVLGVQTAETFDERAVGAYGTVVTVIDLATALHDAGTITLDDFSDVVNQTEELKKGIDLAIALKNAGDFTDADTRLAVTIRALETLQAVLRSRQ